VVLSSLIPAFIITGVIVYLVISIIVALTELIVRSDDADKIPKWVMHPTKIKHHFCISFLVLYIVLVQLCKIINHIMEIDLPKAKICPYCGEPDCWGMKNRAVKGVKQPSCSYDSYETPIRRFP